MNSTALLVIDVQRGAFDGQRCSPIEQAQLLIDHTMSLVGAVRDSGTPVIFIQHCDGVGEVFEEGTPHWRLHESLAPRPGEAVVKKRASSAFERTNLATVLAGLNVNELVLCGLQSEFCVFNTAKSALGLGYKVRMAEDGHSTWASGTESAAVISKRVNTELAASGASLESTSRLTHALREARS